MKLLEINSEKFNVDIDLRYATDNNFTGNKVYNYNKCFLIKEALDKLKKAIILAEQLDYKIRIYDSFRTQEAQKKLWDFNPDPNFLSDPQKGSPHSRGVAIDLTLLDSRGKELDMGTEFDTFDKTSFHGNHLVGKEATINRHILLSIMTIAGFDFYINEWWHYQLFNSREYPLIDIKP